jgi:CheY-like chemotaxis protein
VSDLRDERRPDESDAQVIVRLERRAARERAARLEAELIAESQLRRSHERAREVERFASIAVLVNESRDALSTVGAAAKILRRHCDFAVSHVLVPDHDGAFVTADIWDADPGALEFLDVVMAATVDEPLLPPRGLPGEVAASHLAMWLPDLSSAAAHYPHADRIAGGASWAMPVVAGVEVVAVVEFVHPTPRAADERLLQLAPSLGSQLGRAFDWEALERRQVADRRRLEDLLAQRSEELQTVKRETRLAEDARSSYLAYLVHEAEHALDVLHQVAQGHDPSASDRAALTALEDTVTQLVTVVDGGNRRILGERTAIALDTLVTSIVAPYADAAVPVVPVVGPDDREVVTALQVSLVTRAAHALVDNAIAHSGTDRVEVSVSGSSDSITVEVRDHGAGYTWPDNGGRPAGGGGLAQTARLTQSLGGGLDVTAHPEGGTSARVRIAARPGGPAAWVSRSTRVLLVDDNEINRRLAGAMLAKIGLDSDVVDGGAAALDAMERTAYGLVLMDVQMPEIDGREVTRRWRAGSGGATQTGVPIVALTAHVGQAERDSCRDAGMTDYLSKPFGLDALAQMARTYLDPSDQRDGSGAGVEVAKPSPATGAAR